MLSKTLALISTFCVAWCPAVSLSDETNGAEDSASIHYDRGLNWHAKKVLDKAISEYTAAIQIDPPSSAAYFARALAWYDSGDFDNSIADYNEVIRLNRKNKLAYHNRAAAWAAMGEFGKAIADYREAIRLDASYASAYKSRAWILATCPDDSVRDGKRAVESAIRACELTDWKEPSYLDALAAAYAEAGDFDAAVETEAKAIAITRDFAARLTNYQNKTWQPAAAELDAHLSQSRPATLAFREKPERFFIVPYDATLYLSAVGGVAGAVTEFGLGTSEDQHIPIFTGLPANPHPMGEVKVCFVKAGSELHFYEKTEWGGIHWAFTEDASSKATRFAFFDDDNSLGLDGSAIEKTGPETWILHLDDAASGDIDDNDEDVLIQMHLVPTSEAEAMEPSPDERK